MAGKKSRYIIMAEGKRQEVPDHISNAMAIRSLRKGDEFHVARACDLVGHKREIKATIDGIHKRGAVAVADDKGTKSRDPAFILDMIEGLHKRSYFLPSEEASRRAKIGSKKRLKRPMPKAEALKIWRDPSYTTEQAASALGVASITAYRWLGRRGKAAGRPAKKRK